MALFLFLLLHLKSDPQLQAVSAPPNQFTRRVWLGANDWPVRDDTHRPEAQELNIEKLRWQFSPVTGGQLGRLTGLFHKWIPGQPKYDSCLTPAQGDKPRWKRKWVQPSLNLLLKRRNRESDNANKWVRARDTQAAWDKEWTAVACLLQWARSSFCREHGHPSAGSTAAENQPSHVRAFSGSAREQTRKSFC